MSLIERKIVDKIEILRDGQIQVRHAIEIVDEATGEVKGSKFWRCVLVPGEDTKAQELLKERVAIKDAVWTQKVRDDWAAKQKEAEKEIETI